MPGPGATDPADLLAQRRRRRAAVSLSGTATACVIGFDGRRGEGWGASSLKRSSIRVGNDVGERGEPASTAIRGGAG